MRSKWLLVLATSVLAMVVAGVVTPMAVYRICKDSGTISLLHTRAWLRPPRTLLNASRKRFSQCEDWGALRALVFFSSQTIVAADSSNIAALIAAVPIIGVSSMLGFQVPRRHRQSNWMSPS